jgi:glycosyltransferase involved in cell wall biosynthesis
MPHISAVLPLYNEEATLPELYRRLAAALAGISGDYEIVLVDDGSRDKTWAGVEELAGKDRRVKGVQLARNFGQHYAITAGMDACDGDWVVVMDSDLQDRPEEIPGLYAKAQEGFDVVVARRGRRKDGALKRLTSGLFYRIFSWLTETRYDPQVGNFRIMSRRVVENFRTVREQLRFFGGIVDWMGFRRATLPVQHAERFAGRGAYNFAKLWRLAQDIVIAHSDKPLRLVIPLAAFVYGVYVVVRGMLHRVPVAGWPSLIASVYFLGGIIISILGIIGLYLGRTFSEAKKRPLYVVRQRTGE